MLFRRVSFSNYPKSTKIWPFLFISHACPVFLKYALRDQKLHPPSFSWFFLTNMINNYVTSFPSWIIFEFCFIGNIVTENQSTMNLFSSVSYCILYTHYLSFRLHGKSGNFIKHFFLYLYFDSLLNTCDFSNFIFSNFMGFFWKIALSFHDWHLLSL